MSPFTHFPVPGSPTSSSARSEARVTMARSTMASSPKNLRVIGTSTDCPPTFAASGLPPTMYASTARGDRRQLGGRGSRSCWRSASSWSAWRSSAGSRRTSLRGSGPGGGVPVFFAIASLLVGTNCQLVTSPKSDKLAACPYGRASELDRLHQRRQVDLLAGERQRLRPALREHGQRLQHQPGALVVQQPEQRRAPLAATPAVQRRPQGLAGGDGRLERR